MKDYKVVEIVHETLRRERTWNVCAISEHDAIRQIIEGAAADDYDGKHVVLEASSRPQWVVDGLPVTFKHHEAVAMDDGYTEIGCGD